MTKTKQVPILLISTIVLSLSYAVYKDRTFFDPTLHTKIEFQKNNITIVKDRLSFWQKGCYVIGLHSDGNAFDFYGIRGSDGGCQFKE